MLCVAAAHNRQIPGTACRNFPDFYLSLAMNPTAAYEELVRRAREDSLLASCADLLAWDEETYIPPGGIEHRSNQLALLAGLLHDRATDPCVGDLLGEIEQSSLVHDPESAVATRSMVRHHAMVFPS